MTKKERIERIIKIMTDIKHSPLLCLNYMTIMYDETTKTCITIDCDYGVSNIMKLPSKYITAIFNDLKKDFNI